MVDLLLCGDDDVLIDASDAIKKKRSSIYLCGARCQTSLACTKLMPRTRSDYSLGFFFFSSLFSFSSSFPPRFNLSLFRGETACYEEKVKVCTGARRFFQGSFRRFIFFFFDALQLSKFCRRLINCSKFCQLTKISQELSVVLTRRKYEEKRLFVFLFPVPPFLVCEPASVSRTSKSIV